MTFFFKISVLYSCLNYFSSLDLSFVKLWAKFDL